MRYFFNLRYLIVVLALLCSACGTALPTIKPYKLDVQQGNVVTSKMLLQLRPGMTKSQVRFIMGTPLIQDGFHGNRWDYAYQMRESGKITEQRRVILEFENELLKSVRGDVVPAGGGDPKTEEGLSKSGTRVVAPYKKPEEKSLLSKLKFWEKDATATAEPAEKAVVKSEGNEKSAAPEALVNPAAKPESPVEEEPKSILAVPLEVPVAPVEEGAVVQPAAEDSILSAPVTAAPATAVATEVQTQTQPVVEAVGANVAVVAPVEVAVQEPSAPLADVKFYESTAGMIFDRKLRSVPEEAAPEVVAQNSGTQVMEDKDVTPPPEPSFFDRMLEKIGF